MSGSKGAEIEHLPDGWTRFEKAVDAALRSGPQGRKQKKDGPKKPIESSLSTANEKSR